MMFSKILKKISTTLLELQLLPSPTGTEDLLSLSLNPGPGFGDGSDNKLLRQSSLGTAG